MDRNMIKLFFALIRAGVCGGALFEDERALYGEECLGALLSMGKSHDVDHLIALGLKNSGLLEGEAARLENLILKTAFRFERLDFEYKKLCGVLEDAKIPFLPLKGAVLRRFYPEPWMRTSCDIDVLVHPEDLQTAIECLCEKLKYKEHERATHDVSLFSPVGNHIELHFDLVEEGRANSAIDVLSSVWDTVIPCEGSDFCYEMPDDLFYFYHIAHMAKHFEEGGCGVRPFIDLYILDRLPGVDFKKRDDLLSKYGLIQFANNARRLSKAWFCGGEYDDMLLKMQAFILQGGSFGTIDNRVALKKSKKSGPRYLLSRIFVPYSRLKRYYPVLEKHPLLFPLMQVRRWFMLLKPDVRNMAKNELALNSSLSEEQAEVARGLLRELGL